MHSKPQKERWLHDQLSTLEIETYYPCLQIRNGKRFSHTTKPYFPGYLFVNVDLETTGRSVLNWIPGSLGLVRFGEEPACVPEGLLQKIRHRVDEMNGARNKLFESLRPGDGVVIHSGPFAGYDAIFCSRLRDSERIQVLLKVLQDRTIRVDLQVNQIKTTKQNRTLS
jgi:transcriptional antiterminator RfaH